MKHGTVLACTCFALSLSSCAADIPVIAYDENELVPAIEALGPPPPERITSVPLPLPLRGEVRANRAADRADLEDPWTQIEAQRLEAQRGPADAKAINAITVYPFAEGVLYQVYAAPERVTDIALQAGETLQSVAAGDTVRWVIGDTASGAGAVQQVHILVKPFAGDLATNLVILTDRRAYHLELISTEDPGMSAIAWTYPQDELLAIAERSETAAARVPIETGLALDALRFRYRIEGDTPPWRPRAVFDDGSKVYIQFPQRIDQGEMPPLFVLGAGGKAEFVNYRVRRNFYIVDRLFAAAELRLGEDPQAIVRILRTDAMGALPTAERIGVRFRSHRER